MAPTRTARLLELLGLVQARTRFTAAELAQQTGVSRRTILRDLRTLERLGVVLESTPGPGGGYRIPWERRRLALSFTADEAVALVAGFDAFRRHHVTPLAGLSDYAVTKIRAALPVDVGERLAQYRDRLALQAPVHVLIVPCLDRLFEAAVAGKRLSIVYESVASAPRRRTIEPVGLYAEQGIWYCACREGERDRVLRADRVREARTVGAAQAARETLSDWFERRRRQTQRVALRCRVSARGAKRHELQPLLERGRWQALTSEGWEVCAEIDADDLDYWADRFMAVGADGIALAPAALVTRIRRRLTALAEAYDGPFAQATE